MKTIHIYTLAEKKAFRMILYNFLGKSPRPTYSRLNLTSPVPPVPDPEQEIVELLKEIKENEGVLHIKHIFVPFNDKNLDDFVVWRKYHDDSLGLLKLLLHEQDNCPIVFDFDGNDPATAQELERVALDSPPLYDKLIRHLEKRKKRL